MILESRTFHFLFSQMRFSNLPSMHYCLNTAWNWRKLSQKCWVDTALVIWGGGGGRGRNGTSTWSLMTMGSRDGWRGTEAPRRRLQCNDRQTDLDRSWDTILGLQLQGNQLCSWLIPNRFCCRQSSPHPKYSSLWTDWMDSFLNNYEGWNFNSGNYLFTTDTK